MNPAELSPFWLNAIVISHVLVAIGGYIVGMRRGKGALKRRLEQIGSRMADQL